MHMIASLIRYPRDAKGNLVPVRRVSLRASDGVELREDGTAALLGSGGELDADGGEAVEIDFEAYCALVRRTEPNAELLHDKMLRARFRAIDLDGSGTINRREYVQSVVLERLAAAASRIVTLFMAWDSDKNGSIDLAEFTHGIRALGLSAEAGFLDVDVEAVFHALDADGSGHLEYAEIASSLAQTKRKVVALRRLRQRLQAAAVRVLPASSSADGKAGAGAGAISPDKAFRMFELVNEVQETYDKYREHRVRLGPVAHHSALSPHLVKMLSPRRSLAAKRARPPQATQMPKTPIYGSPPPEEKHQHALKATRASVPNSALDQLESPRSGSASPPATARSRRPPTSVDPSQRFPPYSFERYVPGFSPDGITTLSALISSDGMAAHHSAHDAHHSAHHDTHHSALVFDGMAEPATAPRTPRTPRTPIPPSAHSGHGGRDGAAEESFRPKTPVVFVDVPSDVPRAGVVASAHHGAACLPSPPPSSRLIGGFPSPRSIGGFKRERRADVRAEANIPDGAAPPSNVPRDVRPPPFTRDDADTAAAASTATTRATPRAGVGETMDTPSAGGWPGGRRDGHSDTAGSLPDTARGLRGVREGLHVQTPRSSARPPPSLDLPRIPTGASGRCEGRVNDLPRIPTGASATAPLGRPTLSTDSTRSLKRGGLGALTLPAEGEAGGGGASPGRRANGGGGVNASGGGGVKPSVDDRWGGSLAAEGDGPGSVAHLMRMGSQRDHHAHVRMNTKVSEHEPKGWSSPRTRVSAWQRQMRMALRDEMLTKQTSQLALASVQARLRALKCFRDSVGKDPQLLQTFEEHLPELAPTPRRATPRSPRHALSPPSRGNTPHSPFPPMLVAPPFEGGGGAAALGDALGREMELGPFGQLGLGVGSPPRTPHDERAMRNWQAPPTDEAALAADLQQASRQSSRQASPERATLDRMPLSRDWVAELATGLARAEASIGELQDLLTWHGLPADQFALDGEVRRQQDEVKAAEEAVAARHRASLQLVAACEQGDMPGVKWFLEKGASVKVCNARGATALEAARSRGNQAIIEYLLEHGDVEEEESEEEEVPEAAEADHKVSEGSFTQRKPTLTSQRNFKLNAEGQIMTGTVMTKVKDSIGHKIESMPEEEDDGDDIVEEEEE